MGQRGVARESMLLVEVKDLKVSYHNVESNGKENKMANNMETPKP